MVWSQNCLAFVKSLALYASVEWSGVHSPSRGMPFDEEMPSEALRRRRILPRRNVLICNDSVVHRGTQICLRGRLLSPKCLLAAPKEYERKERALLRGAHPKRYRGSSRAGPVCRRRAQGGPIEGARHQGSPDSRAQTL